MLHAVEHLRGHNHWLLISLAYPNDLLLHYRHAGHIDFNPQIAPCHHDGISHFDNRFEVIEGFSLLDFGYHPCLRTPRSQEFLEKINFDCRPHKRQTDKVGPGASSPFGMLPIGLTDCRHREFDAR